MEVSTTRHLPQVSHATVRLNLKTAERFLPFLLLKAKTPSLMLGVVFMKA
jgi:hypothetical protein